MLRIAMLWTSIQVVFLRFSRIAMLWPWIHIMIFAVFFKCPKMQCCGAVLIHNFTVLLGSEGSAASGAKAAWEAWAAWVACAAWAAWTA